MSWSGVAKAPVAAQRGFVAKIAPTFPGRCTRRLTQARFQAVVYAGDPPAPGKGVSQGFVARFTPGSVAISSIIFQLGGIISWPQPYLNAR